MTIQIARFETGGFVLHKIPHTSNPNLKFSAWFDASGKLTDCERINKHTGAATTIPVSSTMVREYLSRIGKRYV